MAKHFGTPIHFPDAIEKADARPARVTASKTDEVTTWGDVAFALVIPGAILLTFLVNYLIVMGH